jgi:hypothetical protein
MLLAVFAVAALSGCGSGSQSRGKPAGGTTRTAALVSRAQATHEYPGPASPVELVIDPAGTPEQAIRSFVVTFINWDASDVAARLRGLAAASVGQARSFIALAAARASGDYELQRGGIANAGSIEAIAPLPGRRDRYVVVTLERTTATATSAYDGLRPAWHVAVASVVAVAGGGWAVSSWQPES